MHRIHGGLIAVALLTVAILCPVRPVVAGQPAQSSSPTSRLSPYWGRAVQRWESVIVEYADQRGLDPDLIAAVIQKESLGNPRAHGPAGAVGLMMVMPREAGFSWRPTADELEEPWRNVFWGARALATVIRQSHGDLYAALAAYNGGWEQVHLRRTREYAGEVLALYARAVAVRRGLSPEGPWVATVASVDSPDVLTVFGPRRPLTRYTRGPIIAHIPDVVADGLPTAVAFSPPDGQDMSSRVGIWIVLNGQVVRDSPAREQSLPEVRSSPTEAQAPVILTRWQPVW